MISLLRASVAFAIFRFWGDHVQAIDKYDRRGAGTGPLEKELHAVAALTGIIGFEVGERRCEEREPARAGERWSKLSLDPSVRTSKEQAVCNAHSLDAPTFGCPD